LAHFFLSPFRPEKDGPRAEQGVLRLLMCNTANSRTTKMQI
jgi:hypothetical protein